MARETTDEQHADSFHPIGTSSSSLRKKFNITWIEPNNESNELACSSTCSSQPLPSEANRTALTEAELCLLVCSLFPVDFRLPIEDLVVYGMNLRLFGDIRDISEGRCRVYDLIKIINRQLLPRYLNKLCLWEDKYGNQYVKVFHCAKDLAKSIASKYQLVFGGNEIVKGNWPNTVWYEYFYGLSLEHEKIKEHPINLGRHLSLLVLQRRKDPQSILIDLVEDPQSILIDLVEGAKEFMILPSDVQSLPESLDFLHSLRTLRLNVLKLEKMSWIGCLLNLELLSISTAYLTDIPKEMGKLVNLRLIDLRKMSIAYIPPGVFSKMWKLEELYFPLSFSRWGCRAKDLDYDEWESWEENDYDDNERIGASNNEITRINTNISDITSLSLHALEISIPDASVLPGNSSMFNTIRRFKIVVPNNLMYKLPGKLNSTNVLQLTGDADDMKVSGICNLMGRTEDLSLMKVRNLKNVMFQLLDYGFPNLQKMIVSECDELEYVVDTTAKRTLPEDGHLVSNLKTLHLSMLPNLKEIWHGRSENLHLLKKLRQISIRFCHKLKYVFPLLNFRGSIRLKRIQILDCAEMDGIFYLDKEAEADHVLHFIEELHLHSLPKLVGFLVQVDDKISRVHKDTDQSRATNEIVSSGIDGSIRSSLNKIFQCFQPMKKHPKVNESCIEDEKIISRPSIFTSGGDSQENVSHQLVSSQLDSFTLNKGVIGCTEKYGAFLSSKLAEKWMQGLKRLEMSFCDALQIIFLLEENHATATSFNSLIELKLCGLQNLVHVWFQVPPAKLKGLKNLVPTWFHVPPVMIAFQNLKLLVLSECRNLYLFTPRVAKLLVQLQKIYVNQCEKMEDVMMKENEEDSNGKIVFPRLQVLEFEHIPNLKVFYRGNHVVELPLLESLKFNQCNKMEYFSYKSAWTPVLKRILINGSLCALMGDLNTAIKRSHSHDRNGSNKQHSTDEVDDFNELHTTTHEDDELWYDEIDWLKNLDLQDSTTTVDLFTREVVEEANHSCMKEFTFYDLKIATNNFSSDALLGKGSFGVVYKGCLDGRTFSPSKTRSGLAVAIKHLKRYTEQWFHEWPSEAYFLQRLCHPNVIKLLGYCREDGEFLLVFEFMERGSLQDHLFTRKARIEPLSWELRLKVAIGAARGLAVLHSLGNKIVHRDFKPSNILIDANYNAKVSDFGLANLLPSDGDWDVTAKIMETHEYAATGDRSYEGYMDFSTRIVGTLGYMAPEFRRGPLTEKVDVYSFGVVLLEIISGKSSTDVPTEEGYFHVQARHLQEKQGELSELVDPSLETNYSKEEAERMLTLALLCTTENPSLRPSMSAVVEMLEGKIPIVAPIIDGSQSFSSQDSQL